MTRKSQSSSFLLKHWKQYIDSNKGSIAIIAALMLPAVIGFGVLAYEVGGWLQSRQELQQVADISAYSGAYELSKRGATYITDRATYLASQNSFDAGGGKSIVVNNPPSTGAHTADEHAVEVIVQQPAQRSLSNYFTSNPFNITARAVATFWEGPVCILALNSSASGAITVNGTASVNLPTCGLSINSTSSNAMVMTGNETLNAHFVAMAGNYNLSGGATFTTESGVIDTGITPLPNPYANLQVPSYSTCDYNSVTVSGGASKTLNPGVYCKGLTINSSGTVTLNPGTYIIDGGPFTVSGDGKVIGANVTIILSGKISGKFASTSISGTGTFSITAPTDSSNPFVGIALFQDPNTPKNSTTNVVGSSTTSITGVVYVPNQEIKFAGGSDSNAPCTVLIADVVTITGNTNINCPAGSIPGMPTQSFMNLVE